jgi:hypothetical protein
MVSRHKKDAIAAARDYQALFAGEITRESMIAAMRFDTFVEAVIALAEGLKRR